MLKWIITINPVFFGFINSESKDNDLPWFARSNFVNG